MDVKTAIKERRAIYPKQFSGERIPAEVIHELLDLANWAPSHYHTQPWNFKVFSGPGLERLMQAYAKIYKDNAGDTFDQAKYERYAHRAGKVSHAIVIVHNPSPNPNSLALEEIEAVAAAVQNLWLATTAFAQIGGYWSTGNLVYTDAFAEFLELGDGQQCLGTFYLGKLKPDGIKPRGVRKPVDSYIEWINE